LSYRLKAASKDFEKKRAAVLKRIEPFLTKLKQTHENLTIILEDAEESLAKALQELDLLNKE
jgi:hypothetical protein